MEQMKLFVSTNIIFENKFFDGGILVISKTGKIQNVMTRENVLKTTLHCNIEVINVGDLVIMPGIIDSHVHVNEPGRTNWEGFETATKAAAAGGITTIVDMPLNSKPPTTTVANLETKIQAAKGKTYVDVAFWGGIIPGNQLELLSLVEKGVVGFKGFMCPSGVEEFPYLTSEDIEATYKTLENTNIVLAFHAEVEDSYSNTEGEPTLYTTFLKSRPSSMEVAAVKKLIYFCKKYSVRTHVVHVSSAECIPLISKTKRDGNNLTAETCHHYLYFQAEDIPDGATQYKCTPPIRDLQNQNGLWDGLKSGVLDMVVSDHSPCVPDLKQLDSGDFLGAWGGVASLQFGLSAFWTKARTYGLSIFEISKYLTWNPAKLIGLHTRKGVIANDYDADFVIWDPNETFIVLESIIYHKNKLTPYLHQTLHGRVYITVVRGQIVFQDGKHISKPAGELIIKSD